MTPRILQLSVKESAWRPGGLFESDQAQWGETRKRILARDRDTCQYCYLSLPSYMEVHHLDGDHSNDAPENLLTACPFCHATQHIGLAATYRRGVLIFLPELPQQTVNYLALWLELGIYTMISEIEVLAGARDTFRKLMRHQIDVCMQRFGDDSCSSDRLMGMMEPGTDQDIQRITDRNLTRLANTYSKATLEVADMILMLKRQNLAEGLENDLAGVRFWPLFAGYPAPLLDVCRKQLFRMVPDQTSIHAFLTAGRRHEQPVV